MPTTPNYHILCKYKNGIKPIEVIMTYITAEEEDKIDNLKEQLFKINRGNRTFSLSYRNIYCYGEIDFNKKEDVETIKKFNILNHLFGVGIPFPAHYNYENHSCISPIRKYKYAETFDVLDLVKYSHAMLSKPERIVLFKQ